jgi:hypothetical protein
MQLKGSDELRERLTRYIEPDKFLDPDATMRFRIDRNQAMERVGVTSRAYPYQGIGREVPGEFGLRLIC